jgi:catechol 2,3-dioxygenase-like lactoylglutathione lyase family enzyme
MKIWKVALLMTDMEKARELYVEQLGLPIIDRLDVGEHGECLYLDAGGFTLELIPAACFAGVEGLDQPGIHHLSMKADDVESATDDLRQKGITVKKEPFSPAENMTLAFLDGLDSVNLQLIRQEKESSQ